MSTTIILPDNLTHILQKRANENHTPLHDYVIQIIEQSLKSVPIDSLEDVIAEIKAMPADPKAIQRGQGSLLNALQKIPVAPDFDLVAWEKKWKAIEAEIKLIDQMDASRDALIA